MQTAAVCRGEDGAHKVHAPGSGLGRWGGSQKPLGSPKGEAGEGSHSSQVVVR